MSGAEDRFSPTARLRWLKRPLSRRGAASEAILQQWYAPDVPAYMVDPMMGEWRDVTVVAE